MKRMRSLIVAGVGCLASLFVGTAPAAWGQPAHAYVANGISDNVSVIDTSTNTVTATVTVGDGPIGVAVSADGSRAYVANSNSDNVSVIDTSTNTVTATVTVGDGPQSLGDFVGPGDVPVELQRFSVE